MNSVKKWTQCILLLVLSMLLQCCANNESQTKRNSSTSTKTWWPESTQVIAKFEEFRQDKLETLQDSLITSMIDSICAGNDFIRFYAEGSGFSKTEFSVRLEKVVRDSSWFVLRRIFYDRDYSQWTGNMSDFSKRSWKKMLVDSIADTTMYLKMESALECFVPETTTVEKYIVVDSNFEGIGYKKDGRCMDASVSGGYFWDSPGLKNLYAELEKWTREDYFKLHLLKDDNEIYAWSKLNETVKCTVLDSAWKSMDDVNPLEFKKGEQRVAFDFSKRNPNDRILCESEAGFIRNILNLKD